MIIQQLIQSRLFHLISMLLCMGVIVWLFVRHYFNNEPKEQRDKVHLLNTLYISGILTFIVIELLTAICMGNTKHADILSFVSFAATLSSLILSIVAIIFTIVLGKKGESQYYKLDIVSEEVKDSLTKFSEKTRSFDSSIDRFQSIADDLSTQMHSVFEKLSGIEKPIFEMKEAMLPSESGGAFKDSKKKNGGIDEESSKLMSRFVEIGSFSGNLALLACALSKETGYSFKMSEIGENDDDEAYKFGYIIAASAMGVVKVKVDDERVIVVLSCIEGLKDMLSRSLNRYISKNKDADINRENKDRWERISRLFEAK